VEKSSIQAEICVGAGLGRFGLSIGSLNNQVRLSAAFATQLRFVAIVRKKMALLR
jgi:hypothetical protein